MILEILWNIFELACIVLFVMYFISASITGRKEDSVSDASYVEISPSPHGSFLSRIWSHFVRSAVDRSLEEPEAPAPKAKPAGSSHLRFPSFGLSVDSWNIILLAYAAFSLLGVYILLDEKHPVYAFLLIALSYLILWMISGTTADLENYHRSVSLPDSAYVMSRAAQDEILARQFESERLVAEYRRKKALHDTPRMVVKFYSILLFYLFVVYFF